MTSESHTHSHAAHAAVNKGGGVHFVGNDPIRQGI